MPRKTSNGKCEFCQQTFSKQVISRHLSKCEKRPVVTGNTETYYHLLIEGAGAPMYWLHVELPAKAKLATLDQFLRDIWLECCGHLSAFTIHGMAYHNDPESAREFGEKTMNVAVQSVLSEGDRFMHEYDFGSTTELKLKVVETYPGAAQKSASVTLLARNEMPSAVCGVCGQPATDVCAQCIWDGEGFVCEEHAEEHECGEDMLLPVVNSPRIGVCGYSG
jgi:hypothetical protein